LDFFKDLADIRASFRKFAQLLPADGTLFINGDIENWQEITGGIIVGSRGCAERNDAACQTFCDLLPVFDVAVDKQSAVRRQK